ncbi:unnamed protein product [Tuber aestivum]|uniref:Uncharacterized protein n=1 Tax=Tuber aestivum TaxID=59557 RepID=A0A292PIB4_9PEZI|nr:unnamed protein product [Tuber aestivum]
MPKLPYPLVCASPPFPPVNRAKQGSHPPYRDNAPPPQFCLSVSIHFPSPPYPSKGKKGKGKNRETIAWKTILPSAVGQLSECVCPPPRRVWRRMQLSLPTHQCIPITCTHSLSRCTRKRVYLFISWRRKERTDVGTKRKRKVVAVIRAQLLYDSVAAVKPCELFPCGIHPPWAKAYSYMAPAHQWDHHIFQYPVPSSQLLATSKLGCFRPSGPL